MLVRLTLVPIMVALPVGELPAVLWARVLRTAVFGESSGPLVIYEQSLAALVRVKLPSLVADALLALLG